MASLRLMANEKRRVDQKNWLCSKKMWLGQKSLACLILECSQENFGSVNNFFLFPFAPKQVGVWENSCWKILLGAGKMITRYGSKKMELWRWLRRYMFLFQRLSKKVFCGPNSFIGKVKMRKATINSAPSIRIND